MEAIFCLLVHQKGNRTGRRLRREALPGRGQRPLQSCEKRRVSHRTGSRVQLVSSLSSRSEVISFKELQRRQAESCVRYQEENVRRGDKAHGWALGAGLADDVSAVRLRGPVASGFCSRPGVWLQTAFRLEEWMGKGQSF